MNVLRRFPVYEASVRTQLDCEDTKSLLTIFDTRRGLLRPRVDSAVAPNESGGCDINFRVAYTPLWWIADAVLFVAISYQVSFAKEKPAAIAILLFCLAILIVLTFAGLSIRGASLARRLEKQLSRDESHARQRVR